MKVFYFKQFSIQNDPEVMPLTIDPVILASWIKVKTDCSLDILDVGSGSGIISLILAQRYPHASIVAMDISPKAFELSLKNIKNSPFQDRIQVLQEDFFNMTCFEAFDAVISNPPYYENGFLPNEVHKLQSRHGVNFPLESFFLSAYALTKPEGVLAAVYPYTRWNHIRIAAASSGWYVEKLAFLNAKTTGVKSRVMAQWTKNPIDMPPTPMLFEWGSKALDDSTDTTNIALNESFRGLYVNL